MQKRKSKYTREFLEPIVSRSFSFAQVIRELKTIKLTGGSQSYIKDKIVTLGIDTSHFTGQLWSKGQTKETNPSIKKQSASMSYSVDDVLRDGVMFKGRILRSAMLSVGIPYVCSECKIDPMWNGKPLTLHVDHINGNRRDCRIENLRFLCPNCHQQTPTWGNSGNGR